MVFWAIACTGIVSVLCADESITRKEFFDSCDQIFVKNTGKVIVDLDDDAQNIEVTITHPKRLSKKIIVEKSSRVLKLGLKSDARLKGRETLTFKVRLPRLLKISLSGSPELVAQSLFGDKLSIELQGSSAVSIDMLSIGRLSVDSAGSNSIQIGGGSAQDLSLTVAGSGKIDLSKLLLEAATVDISGSVSVHVHVDDQLSGQVCGSSSLKNHGKGSVDEILCMGFCSIEGIQ